MTEQSESILRKFLAIERFNELFDAIKTESAKPTEISLGTNAILATFFISLAPVALITLEALSVPTGTMYPTIAFGICTVLAIVLRSRFKLSKEQVVDWKRDLRLTHVAFALGCIPAVLVLALFPESLAEKQEIIAQLVGPPDAPKPPLYLQFLFLCFLAAWAAITEEFIFRGLMVSVFRRWQAIPTQRQRDIFAAVASAVLFGVAHWAVWGLSGALALTGIGLGFVAGYIANGEKLAPLVVYHFAFDLVSMGVAIFLL